MGVRLSYLRDRNLWLLLLLAFPYLVVGGLSLYPINWRHVTLSASWFDPHFYLYNLILLLLAVLIVPCITFFYVRTMKGEKEKRLARDFSEGEWAKYGGQARELIEHQFRFGNYLGPVATMMLVIILGLSPLLLLKPLPAFNPEDPGLNYGKGANILLVGAFMEDYLKNPESFYHHVVISLTAFQFGFLGAYVYFVTHLVRGYFTLDLSPSTFVSSTVRMLTASILALVLSFALPSLLFLKHERFHDWLPVLSFFLGYFPSRALQLMETLGGKVLRIRGPKYNSTPLFSLSGMSLAHAVRLRREGFDNVENLVHADALGLAVRTGFSYGQLQSWIGQAWLRLHLGADYEDFVKATALTNKQELQAFLKAPQTQGREGQPTEYLGKAIGDKMKAKLDTLAYLLREENE